jgi:hypothetical protein
MQAKLSKLTAASMLALSAATDTTLPTKVTSLPVCPVTMLPLTRGTAGMTLCEGMKIGRAEVHRCQPTGHA